MDYKRAKLLLDCMATNLMGEVQNGNSLATEYYEALDVAFKIIEEKLERENPKPLTLEELQRMGGEPYYHVSLNGSANEWVILAKNIASHPQDYNYGKTWLAYRHKPQHIGEATNMVEGE